MSQRNVLQGGLGRLAASLPGRVSRLVAGSLAVAALAAPASAYVVVTSDNRVFDVATKPEVRGDLVLFSLDGQLVSLRVYDVNVTKTNELNYMLDSGAGSSSLTAQLRQLRPAVPQDDRLMASSRLDVLIDGAISEDVQIVRREMPADMPSFDRDRPGRRSATTAAAQPESSEFSREAKAALDEARRRQSEPAEPTTSSRRGSRDASAAPAESSAPSRRTSSRDAAKVADLDAEIKAEQDYLKKLTGGEVAVADLEGEIDRSMDKIKRLQKRRDAAAADASEVAADSSGSGKYPAGSRESKWERELSEAQAEMQRLRGQQSSAEGREREGIDERIGELQWKIERLQKKIGGG